jgi:hypothetical protein
MSEQRPKRRGGRPRASAEKASSPLVPIDQSQLGPMMRALPSDRWRAAAVARFKVKTNTAALMLAGFGDVPGGSTCMKQMAYEVFHDERMLRALKELGEQHLVAGIPNAIRVLDEIMADVKHKDRLKAAQARLDRAYPLTTHQHVTVEHIDHDAEAVAQLRVLKGLGVAHEKLIEVFGTNGLTRFERLLALEDGKRADAAKVIEEVG